MDGQSIDMDGRSIELQAALDAAREAGRALLGAEPGRLSRKDDGSVVSEADLLADALICARLATAFPGDAILSEESRSWYGGDQRVWVVDPLDGSANFVQRVPIWGVSLALIVGGRPVLGVSHYPTLDLTFAALAGRGAWDARHRLRSAAHLDTGANDLVFHCSRTPEQYRLSLVAKTRVLGCSSLSYALVAHGAARGSIDATARVWDLAAGWLLVEEAGGAIEMLAGQPVWPLGAGDYAGVGFATVAAVDEVRLREIKSGLAPLTPRAAAR
jgi:fructose-1,6-bisphosphatase/inositol monophosphatase family enzyme